MIIEDQKYDSTKFDRIEEKQEGVKKEFNIRLELHDAYSHRHHRIKYIE